MQRRLRRLRILVPIVLFVTPVPTAMAELPPLIPRRELFQDATRFGPQLSPDGRRLAYLAASPEGVVNVWVRTFGQQDDQQLTRDEKQGIFSYRWSGDGTHILFVQDRDGDENWHLYAIAVAGGEARDLTPFPGVRADNILTDVRRPHTVLVGLNRRDPRVMDMHRVDLRSGEVALEAENPGDVTEWAPDADFVIRAAAALDAADASTILRVRDAAGAPWRELQRWKFEEASFDRFQRIVGFSPDGSKLRVQSCRGSNTTHIAEIELATGRERDLVPADPKADLWNLGDYSAAFDAVAILTHPQTDAIQAYAVQYLKPEWRVLDTSLQADFEFLGSFESGIFSIVDRDRDDRRWLVQYESDLSPPAFYVYDRAERRTEALFEASEAFTGRTFARMSCRTFRARDGLEIPCYLTLPVGVDSRRLPLVLAPHGGPWHRDTWGWNPQVQWLANRGYAVLQVQFRGSTGFGVAFVNASTGEMGRRMQDDLTDAVRWAVQEGIADPKRVGIYGGSYGGYAVLAGLAFTPDVYTCGVDVVGPSNLRTLLESFPPYWAPRLRRWILRIGNVLEDEALNRRISPLFHAEAIRAPLFVLHGANDVRVKVAESDAVVATLRAKGREVEYVVYPDEGHGFGRPGNVEDSSARIEAFLAQHLGGRVEPPDPKNETSAEAR